MRGRLATGSVENRLATESQTSAPGFSSRTKSSTGAGSARSRLGDDDAVGEGRLLVELGILRARGEEVLRVDGADGGLEGSRPPVTSGWPSSTLSSGAGSATPLVSMITRSKGGTSPRARRPLRSASVSCSAPVFAQHRQPASRSTTLSVACAMTRLSRPISPSSLTTTAVLASAGSLSALLSSVVLPLPRKPVSRKTGVFAPVMCCSVDWRTADRRTAPASRRAATGLPRRSPRARASRARRRSSGSGSAADAP